MEYAKLGKTRIHVHLPSVLDSFQLVTWNYARSEVDDRIMEMERDQEIEDVPREVIPVPSLDASFTSSSPSSSTMARKEKERQGVTTLRKCIFSRNFNNTKCHILCTF